ncbi:MAG TPA: class I SAM-dependent methyltransferase [Pontibacter sp.]
MQPEYIQKNKALWDARTGVHVNSAFYAIDTFKAGRNSLNEIELALLGDVRGKKLLHLQCHFGQDTLSLARMGAVVTGVDLSDAAITKARELATELNLDARFICCNVLELDKHLTEEFDIVFCSYGVIGWRPDLNAFATIVSRFLKPGGMFLLVEFHPFIWMYDNQQEKICYSYFNTGTIIETEEGTYAEKDAPLSHDSYTWNHPLSDVISSLLRQDLTLTDFREYDYSPYNIFRNMEQHGNRFKLQEGKLPLVFSVMATRK